MLYFVIRVHTYTSLSNDYTVKHVLTDKDDALTLAQIFTKMDNDPEIYYIVTQQVTD